MNKYCAETLHLHIQSSLQRWIMTGHHEFEIDKKSDIWVRKEHATFDSSLDNPWVMFNHSSVPKTCGMHHDITLRQTQ